MGSCIGGKPTTAVAITATTTGSFGAESLGLSVWYRELRFVAVYNFYFVVIIIVIIAIIIIIIVVAFGQFLSSNFRICL